jgi:hypothetical protein
MPRAARILTVDGATMTYARMDGSTASLDLPACNRRYLAITGSEPVGMAQRIVGWRRDGQEGAGLAFFSDPVVWLLFESAYARRIHALQILSAAGWYTVDQNRRSSV